MPSIRVLCKTVSMCTPRKDKEKSPEHVLHGIGFADLVSYIEMYRGLMETKQIFRMADD